MDLDKAVKERHSVRRFTSKSPDWRDILKAVDSARLAPLAGNINTIKFVIVSDKSRISQLAQASQQEFVKSAKYVVVVCSDSTQLVRSYDERGKMYSRQQAGAVIENFLLKLTALGLSTCWVGAFVDSQVKRALLIPDNIEVEAMFPIGYEMGKSKQKPKPNLDSYLFFDTWRNKYMNPLVKPEAL